MKKIKLLSLAVVLGLGSIFITSCGDTEDVAPKPVLEFIGGSGYVSDDITLAANTDFVVGINASHTEKMKSIKISVSYDGGAEVTPVGCSLCDSTLNDAELRVDFKGTTEPTAGTEVWNFTIADKDGNSTTKSITITNIGDGGATLIEYLLDNNQETFKVWNFAGAKEGAYQLGCCNLKSSDPNSDKDIQDSTAGSEIANWPARWTSRNGTQFKKATTYNWANVTNEAELEAAWNGSGTAETAVEVADGDVYIANIKNAGTYALIEITDVVETMSDNNDYVQFRYKLAP
ncbi:MAG: hypothetical protein KJP21_02190 [Bacteroidia bacterium]|nr:hypothetical protein [Bacteroidia bacterium]NNJ56146.1 hypothetical protein [Bacteroidia bacterium]